MSPFSFLQKTFLACSLISFRGFYYAIIQNGSTPHNEHKAFDPPVAMTAPNESKRTLHILHGLNGNATGFIDEWEVNLKSVLANAPLDADLHIHALANGEATTAVTDRIHKAGLIGSRWRNQVILTVYNVDKYVGSWRSFLDSKLRGNVLDERISIGGYFRLFAHEILKAVKGPLVYMDTDVVILTNLNEIFGIMDETKIWQFGSVPLQNRTKRSITQPNSGFMIINTPRFHEFWELLDRVPIIKSGSDQSLLIEVEKAFPNATGLLPTSWSVHRGHGWRNEPQTILDKDQDVSFVHFTGSYSSPYYENGLDKFCIGESDGGCEGESDLEKFRKSWGLAEYYVRITWRWLLYFATSSVRPHENGHLFKFDIIE
jgi:hypothetical protein